MAKVRPTLVLNVVGLTPKLIGDHTPHLAELARRGVQREIGPVTPGVTCSAQATYLTGTQPSQHGIVGNGWYDRDQCEVMFWKQSNKLVSGEKVWDAAKNIDSSFTCANLFWWYNMYSSVDLSVTPRPMYPADGRKIPDIYTYPPQLRSQLQHKLGQFPLFHFWGPTADIQSSRWITKSAIEVLNRDRPNLALVYLPHLDYNLQRLGPNHPDIAKDLGDVDTLCGELISEADSLGYQVIVLSEYGITEVSSPVHINRALRDAGFLSVREELGTERLDAGASRAFAVADHQIAHIYVNDSSCLHEVRDTLAKLDGVEHVFAPATHKEHGLAHSRSGELVAISQPDRWFSYYYWQSDRFAPDFARCVDIHRKPGYDPVELFVDPKLRLPKLQIGWRLLQKKLGFRTLMDVIPLDGSLVRGSHGRTPDRSEDGPVFITSAPENLHSSFDDTIPEGPIPATSIKHIMLDHLFGQDRSA